MMAASEGSLPVIWATTSAPAMMAQSSYFCRRHHCAAAAGSPYVMPPAEAPAGAASPRATAPTAALVMQASRTVLAALVILRLMVGPSLIPRWRGVEKRVQRRPFRYLHEFLE